MKTRTRAWLIIAGSTLFILLVLMGKLMLTPAPECDPAIKSKTVIVIDRSEEVAKQTADLIAERAWDFVDNRVREGERVSVFFITEGSQNNLKPAFSMCKPRKKGNRITENANKVADQFRKKFETPLREVLSAPIGSEKETPLAQGLIDLSLDDKHFRSSDSTNLLVFSDFMENTACFSMYKHCSDGTKAIEQFRNCRVGSVERPKFRNACIRMNIIPRSGSSIINRQTVTCRDRFWNWFFGDIEGKGCVGEHNNVNVVPDYLGGK